MHRRTVIISILLVGLMIVSAGVVNASGGNGHEPSDRESYTDEYREKHKHPKPRRGDKTIKLLGLQEPDEASIITVDGRVFTGDEPLPEDHEITPGEKQVFRERLFGLDDSDPDNPQPRGEQIGTVLADCTVITVGDDPEDPDDAPSVLCTRMFTIDGRGDIAAAESFTFADPLEDTIPITGGTGKFRDAGGEISFELQEIEGTDLSNSIYTVRLLHLEDGRRHR